MSAILKKLAFWGLPLAVLTCGASAFGTVLLPGDTLNYGAQSPSGSLPGTESTTASLSTFDLSSLTLIASTGLQNYTTVGGNGISETGTAIADVFQNSDLTLDFVYQYTVVSSTLSTGSINAAGIDNYAPPNFLTDVYYGGPVLPASGGLVAGTSGVGVTGTASRSSDGTVVNFESLVPAVSVGTTSPIFVVKTNADNYTLGSFNLLDNGIAPLNGYEPALGALPPTSVALPATCNTGLLLLGCIGGFGAIRRRVWA